MARTWWPRWEARATTWAPMPPEAPKTVMFMVRYSCSSRRGAWRRGIWHSRLKAVSCPVRVRARWRDAALVGQFPRGNPVAARVDVIGADQHARAARQAASKRARREHRRPGDRPPPPPEQITGPASEQQQAPVGDQVARQDP